MVEILPVVWRESLLLAVVLLHYVVLELDGRFDSRYFLLNFPRRFWDWLASTRNGDGVCRFCDWVWQLSDVLLGDRSGAWRNTPTLLERLKPRLASSIFRGASALTWRILVRGCWNDFISVGRSVLAQRSGMLTGTFGEIPRLF